MNRNLLIVGGLLIAYVLFTSGYQFPGATGGTGFSTLSLTQGTNYISSDPFFGNTPSYTVAVVADGSSGYLRGTFTPAQMGEFTTNHVPASSFDITIQVNDELCTYTIKNDSTVPVYSFGWTPTRVNEGGSCSCQPVLYEGCARNLCDGMCGFTPLACAGVSRTKIGDMYRIDSTPHYDSKINVSLITTNVSYTNCQTFACTPETTCPPPSCTVVNTPTTYSLLLSPQNTNGEVVGLMKASLIGGLQGTQGCPVPATDTVLFRPVNTNKLYAKSITLYNQVYSYSLNSPQATEGISVANGIIQQFLASNASVSSYCQQDTNLVGASAIYSCSPVSPVYLPLIKMVIKADLLGIVSPSGTPKIVSIDNPLAAPGQTTGYDVTLQNIGAETDSFDLSITGTPAVNLQASRISLTAGEQRTVKVYIQGAGIIGQYALRATSVNDPKKYDSMTFKLKVDPYCDRAAEPGKVKTSTEFGCYYTCANQYSTDVREKTCNAFGSFETRGAYISVQQSGLDSQGHPIFTNLALDSELHCTGIGQYTNLIDYMDYVASPTIEYDMVNSHINYSRIFKPAQINGAVWLPAPICNYVGEYGYHFENGQVSEINSAEFNANLAPANGNLVSVNDIVTCPTGYIYDGVSRQCKFIPPTTNICPTGTVYNSASLKCEAYLNTTIVCANSATYNPQTMQCELYGNIQQLCEIGNWDAVRQACIYVPPTLNTCASGTYDSASGFCVVNPQPYYSCPTGTVFNPSALTCDITPQVNVICLAGVYNAQSQKCELIAPVGYVCQVGTYNSQRGFCEVTPPTSKICLQGTYNPNTDTCDIYPGTEIKCAAGVYNQLRGVCEITPPSSKVCPTGTYNANTDKCEVYPGASVVCTTGTYNAARGVCEITPPIGNVCLQGTYNANTGKCEIYPGTSVVCPQGIYNPASARCEITPPSSKVCSTGFTYSATLDKCISNAVEGCPTGYTFANNQCHPAVSSTCPEGFILTTGVCTPEIKYVCPSGYELKNNACERSLISGNSALLVLLGMAAGFIIWKFVLRR